MPSGVIGGTTTQGIITSWGAGTRDLYVTNNGAGDLTIRSKIMDGSLTSGGTGTLRLIVTSLAGNVFLDGAGQTFTGGTVINGAVTVGAGFLAGTSIVVNNGTLSVTNGGNLGVAATNVVVRIAGRESRGAARSRRIAARRRPHVARRDRAAFIGRGVS